MSKERFLESVDVGGPSNNNNDLEESPMDDDGEATQQEDTNDLPEEDADEASPNLPTPKDARKRNSCGLIKNAQSEDDTSSVNEFDPPQVLN